MKKFVALLAAVSFSMSFSVWAKDSQEADKPAKTGAAGSAKKESAPAPKKAPAPDKNSQQSAQKKPGGDKLE